MRPTIRTERAQTSEPEMLIRDAPPIATIARSMKLIGAIRNKMSRDLMRARMTVGAPEIPIDDRTETLMGAKTVGANHIPHLGSFGTVIGTETQATVRMTRNRVGRRRKKSVA